MTKKQRTLKLSRGNAPRSATAQPPSPLREEQDNQNPYEDVSEGTGSYGTEVTATSPSTMAIATAPTTNTGNPAPVLWIGSLPITTAAMLDRHQSEWGTYVDPADDPAARAALLVRAKYILDMMYGGGDPEYKLFYGCSFGELEMIYELKNEFDWTHVSSSSSSPSALYQAGVPTPRRRGQQPILGLPALHSGTVAPIDRSQVHVTRKGKVISKAWLKEKQP